MNQTPDATPAPLKVMFIVSSLGYGGAETLLVNLIRGLDRDRIEPHLICTKVPGPLGDRLASEFSVAAYGMKHKMDVRVLPWIAREFRQRHADAIVTVGAGDKMFWGRLAAWLAGIPVITSALHTNGFPDEVGLLNRWLTPLNDAFIAVAQAHSNYLATTTGLPSRKIKVIPNGVDVQRFRPLPENLKLRQSLNLPSNAFVAGIVARLNIEKNHEMFLRVAARIRGHLPNAHFLIIGDGPREETLKTLCAELNLNDCVQFLGSRDDIPELLSLMDLFLLTSHTEANPVSILESLAAATPVIATRVGSVAETVLDGINGYIVDRDDIDSMVQHALRIQSSPSLAQRMGEAGREHIVNDWSLKSMVNGYESLLEELHIRKTRRLRPSEIAAGVAGPLPAGTSSSSQDGQDDRIPTKGWKQPRRANALFPPSS